MRGRREEINVVLNHIDRYMPHCLYGVCVKQHVPPPADRPDLPDRLDRPDLIVGIHDRDQTGIIPQCRFDFLRPDDAVPVHVQQGDVKAFLAEPFQRVQYGMMFEGRGDDVHLPVLPAQRRR